MAIFKFRGVPRAASRQRLKQRPEFDSGPIYVDLW